MNQEKIGKFIQELRKEKNMTQQELANMLGITDRAVSHWENCRSIPDISLFKPLCDIFNITVNELIIGEKIRKEKLQKKSDENIINSLNENIKQRKKSKNIIMVLIFSILVLLLIFLFIINSFYPKIDLYNFTLQRTDPEKPYLLEKQINVNNRSVYYYGLDFAMFCEKNEKCYQVTEALKHKQITLEKFQKYLEKQVEYGNFKIMSLWDGGTSIYSKGGMQIMFCNTIDGNKDIYIGNDKMLDELNGEYCGHERNKEVSFIRTYKVISSIINEEDDEFNYVTLKQNNGSTSTVLINNSFNLIPGHTYEFTFMTFDSFLDTIENIFNNSTLIKVLETDKSSLNQINEEILVNESLNNNVELNELEHVKMDVIKQSKTSARIRIIDYSANKYIYGEDFRLDKKENNEWVMLKPKKDLVFNSIAYIPDQNGYIELDIDWTYVYGKLSKGKYRIVKSSILNSDIPCKKECKNYYISAEFEI